MNDVFDKHTDRVDKTASQEQISYVCLSARLSVYFRAGKKPRFKKF